MRYPIIAFISISAALVVIGTFVWLRLSPQTAVVVFAPKPRLYIQQIYSSHDEDGDGINDTQDLLDGARAELERHPNYRSAYYQNGYPPNDEGVCTDLAWRAFRDAGYDLKRLVDADIKNRTDAYARVNGEPDPNIDFRRVPNLNVFFKTHAISLTTEIKPGDAANLKEWQGGDLVLFDGPKSHIGIVSDRRDADGVALLIHNAGSTREDDGLRYWPARITPIIGHYRWPKTE